jgi:pimeloyl-ACP methyl ester carboxylesterase
MGGFATLHFDFRYPERALSLVVASCGYGAEPSQRERFSAEADAIAGLIERDGMAVFTETFASGPTRVQYENKDPHGFYNFKKRLSEHSAPGSANTIIRCQKERPLLYDLTDKMGALNVPTLILTGDEDWPCLAPGIVMN